MEHGGELRSRHRNEADFFDREADLVLRSRRSFRIGNTKTYEDLFMCIPQFRPVVPFFGNIDGKSVLDLGCGDGWTSIYFARSGAHVNACDISPKSITLARSYAEENGLSDRITASVMPAEMLLFPDDHFDLVFMNAALHHCDIDLAAREIHRVLKPGGRCAVIEDYGYHPVLWIYRRLTAGRHTLHEKPLRDREVSSFRRPFSRSELVYSNIFNIFDGASDGMKSVLDRVDTFLVGAFPFLSKICRIVGIYVEK